MLSVLQEKLGEAHGLAMAAGAVVVKVGAPLGDDELLLATGDLQRESHDTRARCLALERSVWPDLAVEILAHANSTHDRVSDLVGTWFKAGTDPIAAWTFLTMVEAGELAVWTALAHLAARQPGEAGAAVDELAAWALPIQERHLRLVLDGAVRLGGLADPAADRWG